MALKADGVEPPNILVIVTDDQGWADVGYNNPERVYTPNMDRLASGGAVLTNHYVMPQCTPTRVAMFTGRYPGRFAQRPLSATNAQCFPIGTSTLATMLKSSGYETHLAGKWHMGSSPEDGPNHHGFDSSYGSLAGAVGMYDHRYREGNPFENTWHRDHELIAGHENGRHATDLIAEEAIRVIEQERDSPFFLMLTFHAPHTPLDERGTFVDQPTQLDPDRPGRWLNEDEIPWFHDPEGLIQQEADPEKRLFLAVLYHLDDAIGQVVESLEVTGQLDNTLILFSSDNGPQVNWPGDAYPDDLKLTDFNQPLPMRGRKVDVWEGGIHVPGFVHWPNQIKPGGVIDERVHIIDWFPTLAALLDQPTDDLLLDGHDLTGLILPAQAEAGSMDPGFDDRDLYWIWRSKPNRWALRHGDWKIVRYGEGEPENASVWELYNLKEDPRERSNLADEHAEVVERLHELFLVQRAKDVRP
ncbi:MAG: sulfatase-like hydrolase/transferase [Planctomycetota bacterium]